MRFPDIGLLNTFYLGDSVLLEPIADKLAEISESDTFIISRYSELFQHHPRVIGLPPEGPLPPELRVIDMTEAIKSGRMVRRNGRKRYELTNGKYNNLWKAAGLSKQDQAPRLYLSPDEENRASELRRLFGGSCIGLVLHSNMPVKIWPYMKKLLKYIRRTEADIFVISDTLRKQDGYILDSGAYRVIGKPLRELMVYLSFMDLVIGGDTGPMHIAAALGAQTLVLTREFWEDLWPYENAHLLTTKKMGRLGLWAIRPKTVFGSATKLLEPISKEGEARARVKHEKTVALFRLDGLGGSITLADHAKKIFEMTGLKSTAIVRGYGVAFRDNPYIRDVVEVGYVKWEECVEEMKERYSTLAEIRFAPAKWHQSNGRIFEQDFEKSQGLFDEFPNEYRQLEIHALHHVQLTDKYLGLPYDTIDMEIFYFEEPNMDLPERYILITNGVDIQHGAMRQTKVWDGWDELARICPVPTVQVGSLNDPHVSDAIDYRGKTNIAQFFTMLKRAIGVVCNEGGTMHSAYAVKAKNVMVLRGPTRGKLFEYPGHRFIDSYICDICWSSEPDWYVRCPKGIGAICMDTITPERVLYNLQEAINEW